MHATLGAHYSKDMSGRHHECILQADVEASVYHTSRLVSTAALDVMTTQRDVIYTAKAETRVKVHKRDKASVGLTVARLVEEGGPPTKVHSRLNAGADIFFDLTRRSCST